MMSNKNPKFLIAENPMVSDERIFVIHSRSPYIIAEAFHFEMDQENLYYDIQRQFEFSTTVEYPGELIFLGGVFIEGGINTDTPKLMSRMGDWYHSYLKYEDDNLNHS